MKPHEKLGIAIADAGYTWTPDMRSAWEELDKEPKMTKLKPYGYVMKFESGIEAFNTEEYELPDDKRISSVPLYTHPVKELSRELLDKIIIDQQNEIKVLRKHLHLASKVKELTDEEIEEVWYALDLDSNLFDFARAILRKASEK